MFSVLAQMALMISAGIIWQRFAPPHIAVASHRRALTDVVFYILLPALALDVIWRAPIADLVLETSILAVASIAVGLAMMWLVIRWLNVPRVQAGALMLAAGFPNATYFGMPIVEKVFGEWTKPVVLQFDLFGCTPVLLTFGVLMAAWYGGNHRETHPIKTLLAVPPLWAAALALSLNLLAIPQPEFVQQGLSAMGAGVVPLMLIVLGMSLRWEIRTDYIPMILPVVLIQLLLTPLLMLWLGHSLDMDSPLLEAVVLETAMPTMLLGVVLCERYGLDGKLYAAGAGATTLLTVITLPLWFQFLMGG